MSATRQALHDLRGQLSTIGLSARVLERESGLSDIGLSALKRIAIAIERADQELIVLERLRDADTTSPVAFMLPEPVSKARRAR